MMRFFDSRIAGVRQVAPMSVTAATTVNVAVCLSTIRPVTLNAPVKMLPVQGAEEWNVAPFHDGPLLSNETAMGSGEVLPA